MEETCERNSFFGGYGLLTPLSIISTGPPTLPTGRKAREGDGRNR